MLVSYSKRGRHHQIPSETLHQAAAYVQWSFQGLLAARTQSF